MSRAFALPILLLSPTPAVAFQQPARTIAVDGERVEYSTELTPAGDLVIRGRQLSSGHPFRFHVGRSGRVTGVVATTPVTFHVARSLRDGAAREAAAGAEPQPLGRVPQTMLGAAGHE